MVVPKEADGLAVSLPRLPVCDADPVMLPEPDPEDEKLATVSEAPGLTLPLPQAVLVFTVAVETWEGVWLAVPVLETSDDADAVADRLVVLETEVEADSVPDTVGVLEPVEVEDPEAVLVELFDTVVEALPIEFVAVVVTEPDTLPVTDSVAQSDELPEGEGESDTVPEGDDETE